MNNLYCLLINWSGQVSHRNRITGLCVQLVVQLFLTEGLHVLLEDIIHLIRVWSELFSKSIIIWKERRILFARLQRTTDSIMKWLTRHFFQEKVVKLHAVCSVHGESIKDWSCIDSKWKLKIPWTWIRNKPWFDTLAKAFLSVLEQKCMKLLSIWLLDFTVQFLYSKNYTVYLKFWNSLGVLWDWVHQFKIC